MTKSRSITGEIMAINTIYNTWLSKLNQLREKEHKARLKAFAFLLSGLYMSTSVHLSKIARKIPGKATNNSKARRLMRVLDNGHIRVRVWYKPIIQGVLQEVANRGLEIRLLVDGSKIGFGHQLLMIAIAYRRRAIPVAWTWVRHKRGHSSAQKQMALLAYVRSLIPENAEVSIVGDSEFGAISIQSLVDEWGWKYGLRQKGSHLVWIDNQWQRLDAIITRGKSKWLTGVLLTKNHSYQTNVWLHWPINEKEPWLIATNLPSKKSVLATYKRRMWIEEMFGDFKKNGFDLESTHLQHFLRLSRLTLAVALLYLWLVAFGSQIIKNSQRRLVDRNDRRDLSIFRIGFDSIERRLANEKSTTIRLLPYF